MEDKLLRRYILNRANRRERYEVAAWIKESPENLEQFAALKAQLVFAGLPNTIIPERRNIVPIFMRIAAALAVPLLAGGIYLFVSLRDMSERYAEADRRVDLLESQTAGEVTYIANPGTKSLITLPDSSIVHLNGDSKLVVPQRFSTEYREVFLSGEGYFEIRHHDDWPMQIHTSKGVTVKVLGTTFNLTAYDNDSDVRLTLIEGRVVVHEDASSTEHEVRPNQEISVPEATRDSISALPAPPVMKRADIQKNTGWVRGELIFDNTPMPEIVKRLERWYGVNIHIIDEDINKYRLTATFTTESITRVLDLIKFSSLLQYEINGTEVYIRKIKG